MKTTIIKILLFIGIISLGIFGLMVADQYDFVTGRKNSVTTIGNGTPDPLVSGAASPKSYIQPGTAKPVPVKTESSSIDGVKKPR
jgi:hypothetical protein